MCGSSNPAGQHGPKDRCLGVVPRPDRVRLHERSTSGPCAGIWRAYEEPTEKHTTTGAEDRAVLVGLYATDGRLSPERRMGSGKPRDCGQWRGRGTGHPTP